MENNINRLCTICARGGSEGIPGKNLRILNGKPLIVHSIQHAQDSKLFSKIAVSSDSIEILDSARKAGADILVERPSELSSSTAAKLPAIKHCVNQSEIISGKNFETICDLDVTSPLRIKEDILGAVNMCETSNCNNVITGNKSHRSPYFNMVELKKDGFVSIVKSPKNTINRRQDSPDCFDCNASIYVWRRENLYTSETIVTNQTLIFVMPEERSRDIDKELDFEIVEFLMSCRRS